MQTFFCIHNIKFEQCYKEFFLSSTLPRSQIPAEDRSFKVISKIEYSTGTVVSLQYSYNCVSAPRGRHLHHRYFHYFFVPKARFTIDTRFVT